MAAEEPFEPLPKITARKVDWKAVARATAIWGSKKKSSSNEKKRIKNKLTDGFDNINSKTVNMGGAAPEEANKDNYTKLEEDKLKDILESGVPNSWQREMVIQGFDPIDKRVVVSEIIRS